MRIDSVKRALDGLPSNRRRTTAVASLIFPGRLRHDRALGTGRLIPCCQQGSHILAPSTRTSGIEHGPEANKGHCHHSARRFLVG